MKTKCIHKQAKIMVSTISFNKILVSLANGFFFQFSWEIFFTNHAVVYSLKIITKF